MRTVRVPRFSYLGLRDAVLDCLFRVLESVITRDHQCPLSVLATELAFAHEYGRARPQ